MKKLICFLLGILVCQVGCCGGRGGALPKGAIALDNVPAAYAFSEADFLVIAPQFEEKKEDVSRLTGVFLPWNNRIYIKAKDPHNLTWNDYLVLLHEMAHREDQRLGHGGASVLWRILWNSPGGQYWSTHPEIVLQVLKDENERPSTGYYSGLRAQLIHEGDVPEQAPQMIPDGSVPEIGSP